MLVFAFVVLFLPLAVGATRASLLQVLAAPRGGGAQRRARPAGGAAHDHRAARRRRRAGGRGARVPDGVKELPATLLLAPIGFDTLRRDLATATSVGFYERGAIPALVLLLISAPPLYLLTTGTGHERDTA